MTNTIPAIFAHGSKGLMAASIPSNSTIPQKEPDWIPFETVAKCIPLTEDREPAVIVDWTSLRNMTFNEYVMKNMKVRGRNIWLMTWISDVDDLMDSFNTNADIVLIPLHSIDNLDDLRDIHDVSDSVIPVIFVEKGKSIGMRFEKTDLLETLEFLEFEGFYRISVLDTDGTIGEDIWNRILDIYPSTIPFINNPKKLSGFDNVIYPQRC